MCNKHVMQWDFIQYKWVRYRCEFILREFEHSKCARYAMLTSVHKSLQCAAHSAMHNQHWSFGICKMLREWCKKIIHLFGCVWLCVTELTHLWHMILLLFCPFFDLPHIDWAILITDVSRMHEVEATWDHARFDLGHENEIEKQYRKQEDFLICSSV